MDTLLEKAASARGGAAAEALRQAAEIVRGRGDPVEAARLYQAATERADSGPAGARLRGSIELELARLYEEDLGWLDRAMDRYQRAFKANPDDTEAIEAGRRIYRSLGDWPTVARLYEVQLETSTRPTDRARLLGELGVLFATRLGDLPAAAARLEEAARLEPGNEQLLEQLASLYVSPEFPVDPEAPPPTQRAAELLLELGERRRAAGDGEAEVNLLRRALGADPYHQEATARLERAYVAADRREELRRFYQEGAVVHERSRKLFELLLETDDHEAAVEACVEAHLEGAGDPARVGVLESRLAAAGRDALLVSLRERLLDAPGAPEGPARADLLVEIARHHQRAHDLVRFESALVGALELQPAHPDALALLTDHLTQKRDHEGLVAISEAAIDVSPPAEQVRRLGELAELYEKKIGDIARAEETWLRIDALAPSERASSERRRLAQKQERWTTLTAALERELAAAPAAEARAEVLKRLGQVCRDRHELERARQLFEEALALRPGDAGIFRSLTDLAEREGRLDLVAEVLRRQLQSAREKVEKLNLLRRLAVLYDERLDDQEGTVWACEEILAQLPGDRDALRRLATACERGGPEEEPRLISVLERHAQAAATPAEKLPLLHRLADIYLEQGEWALAAERLERLTKLDKQDAKAQEGLARAYEALERWPDAALALERLLPRVPAGARGADAWKRFARVVDSHLGDALRAQRAWQEVVSRRPGDREALEAQARLARGKGDHRQLEEVLARLQASAEPADAATLALERAALLEERLADPTGARAVLSELLEDLEPRHLEAHARLRRLEQARGDVEAAQRIAERELFLTEDEDERLQRALEIAAAWRAAEDGTRRAIAGYERVLELQPDHGAALAALSDLYAATADWEAVLVVDERRLALAEERAAEGEALELYFTLSRTAEEHLDDPARAFAYLRRAHELSSDRALEELRRVAEAHGLWEDLCEVYSTVPGLEGRLAVAEIADRHLEDPGRAFAIIRGALDLDPTGTRLLPLLERLSVRSNDSPGLLAVYQRLLDASQDPPTRVDLLQRRATVREQRLRDPSGALDEILRAYRLQPEDAKLLSEVRRLAETTRRWEDLIAVEGFRFHRAGGAERLAIALDAARLVEEKVRDPLRAFRAYLRALQLAPEDAFTVEQLWRLARRIGTIRERAVPPPDARAAPPAPPRGLVIASSRPARDPTLEIESGELILEPGAAARSDATVELSLSDLVSMQRGGGAGSTVELTMDDLEEDPPSAPPPIPAAAAAPLGEGSHSAWDELASVMLRRPAGDDAARIERFLSVADMWERGAEDLERAFETVGQALRMDPERTAREALEQLAERHQAWDRLVEVLDGVLAETGEADRAVALLLDSAAIRERQGETADAEDRYHRALGMRPDCEEALTRVEALYREGGRLEELAGLLERRLKGLLERLPPGAARLERALELAAIYEQLGQFYEAIETWVGITREQPDHAPAFAALARLYEGMAQWSKVIDAHSRELDLLEASGRDPAQAQRLRIRIGRILEHELELPDRALEMYRAIESPDAPEVEESLDRLYERLGRYAELDELLARRLDRTDDLRARSPLLNRRAELLADRLHDYPGAVEALRELCRLEPGDPRIVERLDDALTRGGLDEERAAFLREQLAQLPMDAPDSQRARSLVELGALEARLGEAGRATEALERALQLSPNEPRALAELARLREGGSDWRGYAAAREREAEVAEDPAHAAWALQDAARVHAERLEDDASARRCLERAIERFPEGSDASDALRLLCRRTGDDDAADELARRELSTQADLPPERQAELHSELAASQQRQGRIDEAEESFRAARAALPEHVPALQGLVNLAAAAARWDEVEALLEDATHQGGLAPQVAAELHRRRAQALEQRGRLDEAYAVLLQADRLVPGDLRNRIALGENRYQAHRYREAAQQLAAAAEHPDAAGFAEEAAQAAYHAALAEQKLRRPERAAALLKTAVRLAPQHEEALGLLAERALEAGEPARAIEFLERQAAGTRGAGARAARFQRLGQALLKDFADPDRARVAYERALEAAGEDASPGLLEELLRLQRDAGAVEQAARTARRLLAHDAPPAERARRLREAASLDAALGHTDEAKDRLRASLELAPLELETLAGLSALLVKEGDDEEAAQLLTRALPVLPPPVALDRPARATLWMRLGECRERLRDGRGATLAMEKAIEVDPGRRPLREALLQRYGDDPAHDRIRRGHLVAILQEDPLHPSSLRAMSLIEARSGAPDQGRRFLELLAIAKALTEEERARLAEGAAPIGDEALPGTLDEADHAALAAPEAIALAPVFTAVWEGTAAERVPDLASYGVGPEDRVSPVASTELARAYAACARALGNRRTGLYRRSQPGESLVEVVAQPPTAIVVGPDLASGRSPAEVWFLVGRALEIARPEFVLAAALSRERFAQLFSALLRAFHPRHARRPAETDGTADEAAAWRRALPYKAAKRLAELFREHTDTGFSSARWRRAVLHTGNRAGLLVAGDLISAARVLTAEDDAEGLRDLAHFAASDAYLTLRSKLHGGPSSRTS